MRFPSKVDWWLVLALGAGLGAGVVSASASGEPRAWLLLVSIGALVGWILLQTDYRLTDTMLEVRCAFYRTQVPVDTIQVLRASRNPLSAPALSLDRIDVQHQRGHVLVSPQDRAGFVAAVRQRAPHVEVVELPGPTTVDAPARGNRLNSGWVSGWQVVSMVVVSVILVLLYVGGSRPPTVFIGRDQVSVRNPLASTSFAPADIVGVSMGQDWPTIRRKVRGYAGFGSLRGRFRVDGLGEGYVFAERRRPVVLVRTTHSFVLIGFDDESKTRRVYDDLRALAPR